MINSEGTLTENERALLVGLDLPRSGWDEEDSLSELRQLAQTAGVEVIDSFIQKLDRPTAPFYFGRGKVDEFRAACSAQEIDVVIVDDDLSPVQQRNLEDEVEAKVIDRTELILDIFAQRAASGEGKLQVELAQLAYRLPRLSGKGVSLSRLGAGIATRGPGETKLETDRQRIRKRISNLKEKMKTVSTVRRQQRKGRENVKVIALVGYTNAGKSTLLNALATSEASAEDKLFTTLDPKARRIKLPDNRDAILVDTVGFIHKLPHHLVEAFKATLEEVTEADILLHVIDASHPNHTQQSQDAAETLGNIGAGEKLTIQVLNKIDQVESASMERIVRDYPEGVGISALKGKGLEDLLERITSLSKEGIKTVELSIPYEEGEIVAMAYDKGNVLAKEHRSEGTYLKAEIDKRYLKMFEKYVSHN